MPLMLHRRFWDPFLRNFHWALVVGFIGNALFTAPDSALLRDLGYVLAALILLRPVWGIIGPRSAKFSRFVASFRMVMQPLSDIATRRKPVYPGHSPLGALMIVTSLTNFPLVALSG